MSTDSQELDRKMDNLAKKLVGFLTTHFAENSVGRRLAEQGIDGLTPGTLPNGLGRLLEAMRYSLLQEGGKRFRPVLAMLTAEALGRSAEMALPVAAAVECIHTYSLIHDDLPAMDNDDFRRGQPTSHKKFDESTAILAGDALLTEAFLFISQSQHSSQSETAVPNLRIISELSRAAGLVGMVGGQAIDMNSKIESIKPNELRTMHRLKTGALIRFSAVGAAIASRADAGQLLQISTYADSLGLAFQVADDLLDFDPKKIEPGSYPGVMGVENTREFLANLTTECLKSLETWSSQADPLREIAKYNQTRIK